MPRKKSHHNTSKRMKLFEEGLETLLATNDFRTMEQLFRSRRFKLLTVRDSRRKQGEAGKKLPLDNFYKSAKDRCLDNRTSKAHRLCLEAFANDDKKPCTRRKAVEPQQVPAKIGEAPKTHKDKADKEEERVKLVHRDVVLPTGLDNVGMTCYAISSVQVLSVVNLLVEKLSAESPKLEKSSLSLACLELFHAKQTGKVADADSAFSKLLSGLGAALPTWSDYNSTHDCEEFLSALVGRIQFEFSLVGVDVCGSVWGCQTQCKICTLEQTSTTAVRRGYLQADTIQTTADILMDVLLNDASVCEICSSSGLVMKSLPNGLKGIFNSRNVLVRVNRFDAHMKPFPGAQLVPEQEVHLEDVHQLSGTYKLRAAVLFHKAKRGVDHYTALVFHAQTHSWFQLNDKDAIKVSQAEAFESISKNGYFLLFSLAETIDTAPGLD